MVNDVDKSLLDRLQALRGGPAGGQPSQAPQNIKVDVIERAKTPSREDALTARLRSLREGSATPEPERQRASPNPAAATAAAAAAAPQPAPTISEKQNSTTLPAASSSKKYQEEEEEVVEHVFETDDDTLQELLADVTPDEDPGGGGGVSGAHEPSDEQVRALLEKLADDIPKDLSDPQPTHDHELDSDNDGSDSEAMKRQVEDVVERYQDEAEMEEEEEEETQRKRQESEDDDDDDFQDPHDEAAAHNADLPSVPSDLQDPLPSSSARSESKPGLDDITARLAALRAPSHNTDGGGDDDDDDDDDASPDSLSLPSVPTSRPSVQSVSRLQTRTGYTDDDADSWCTVCLEDATLQCLGCDDDVYCARCWHEMHVGPAAAFDDRSHRAVQFARDRKKKEAPKKVALGA
ncbi:hypothetical protein NHJ6243_005756 [Beauveria neobassiana]